MIGGGGEAVGAVNANDDSFFDVGGQYTCITKSETLIEIAAESTGPLMQWRGFSSSLIYRWAWHILLPFLTLQKLQYHYIATRQIGGPSVM